MGPRSVTLVSQGEAPDIRVDASIVLVGRSSDCDVVVNSKKFSRLHCCIAIVDNDHLVVRDLGSTNGVQVNGQRKRSASVFQDDEIKIAHNLYRMRWDGSAMARTDGEAKPKRKPPSPIPSERPMIPEGAISDSLLEEADEPIPLSDSGQLRSPQD